MPFEGLRDYLKALEKEGLFHWIDKEVDKDWEIASMARMIFRGYTEDERFGMGFRNISGFPGGQVVAGVIAASTRQIATALETEPAPLPIFERITQGINNPIEPVLVDSGPVQRRHDRRRRPGPSLLPGPRVDSHEGRRPLSHAPVGDQRPRDRRPGYRNTKMPGQEPKQNRHPFRGPGSVRRHPPRQVEESGRAHARRSVYRRRARDLSGGAFTLRDRRAGGCRGRPGRTAGTRPL